MNRAPPYVSHQQIIVLDGMLATSDYMVIAVVQF